MSLVERVRGAGVVGAGGGGYPAHIKLSVRADTVIGNGAECEPLLHKDAAVMERWADRVVAGLLGVMGEVGAGRGVVALKAKNRGAMEAVEGVCRGTGVEVRALGDYYPAGDEYELVHEITGRLIPAAGIPPDVGCVVSNVETLANIAWAEEGGVVTRKTLTVAGAVGRPLTLTVPVGTPIGDCVAAAGGAGAAETVMFIGGLMMGELCLDPGAPVLKTTAGVVVLPAGHRLAQRRLVSAVDRSRIGRSACDQCRYCTEYCPRYLLGYAVEPHQVMRGLGFTGAGGRRWEEWAALCCSCGLCTLFACPEDLFPKEACDEAKAGLRGAGHRWTGPSPERAHALREGRRVPIRGLMRRLGVEGYDHAAPWCGVEVESVRVEMRLKQHAGVAARAVVRVGDRVEEGQVVGEVGVGEVGARVHASVAGEVEVVDERKVVIRRG